MENPVWLNRMIINEWDEIKGGLIWEIKNLKPDAIIHCGDITHFGTKEDFLFGKEVLDATGIDWYAVPGNHDSYTEEIKNEMQEMFGVTDKDGFCYSKVFGRIAIAFFDVCKRRRGKHFFVGDSELIWLENFMEENCDKIIFLVCHIPVRHKNVIANHGTLNCGDEVASGKVFGHYFDKMIGKIENVKELRNLISLNSNVKAVFSGHWHINSLYSKNSVYYKTVPSVCEYPCEVVIADCSTDRIRLYNKPLELINIQDTSIVPEWNNTWVKGAKKTRDTMIFI